MAKKSSTPTIFSKKGGSIELPYEIVYIEWVDAVSQDEWRPISGAEEDIGDDGLVRSVGFLRSKDKENTIICATVNLWSGDISMETTIPTGVIKKFIKITKSNRKKIPDCEYNLTLIKWADAAHKDKWEDGDVDDINAIMIGTVGFEVYSSKKHITLCTSVGTEEGKPMMVFDIKIPAPMVKINEILKEKSI